MNSLINDFQIKTSSLEQTIKPIHMHTPSEGKKKKNYGRNLQSEDNFFKSRQKPMQNLPVEIREKPFSEEQTAFTPQENKNLNEGNHFFGKVETNLRKQIPNQNINSLPQNTFPQIFPQNPQNFPQDNSQNFSQNFSQNLHHQNFQQNFPHNNPRNFPNNIPENMGRNFPHYDKNQNIPPNNLQKDNLQSNLPRFFDDKNQGFLFN